MPSDTSVRLPHEFVGSLVAIRPGRTLVFNVDSPIKRMSKNITIRNISNFPVTYKIKTTSREGYRVKPHMGFLEAGQSADSVITLLPHNQFRVAQDKFLVLVVRASSKLKTRDRRKLDTFWKKFSKDKSGTDYMEHQLSCALNVDEYLANEDDDKFATDSDIDRRFQDENESENMEGDYITPASSVLIGQTPVRKPFGQDPEQFERSSIDYIKSVTPPPFTTVDYITPSVQASAQESVTPEHEYSTAVSSKAALSEDESLKADTSETYLKKEAEFSDNTQLDADGREKKVKRVFKSIMKKKRRSSSKEHSTDEPGSSNKKSQKKVKVIEPKMFQKVRTCSDDDNQISADEVVISLMRTEDVLNRHITCFKGFQVFVVVAICALCVIIIILMVNFPSAISIHKTSS